MEKKTEERRSQDKSQNNESSRKPKVKFKDILMILVGVPLIVALARVVVSVLSLAG